MPDKLVIQTLKVLLADSYALSLKTLNYHWNVTGPNFKSLHLLFEEQYQDLASAIDTIAERIRALGEKAPGTWKSYEKLTKIRDGDEQAMANDMVKQLAQDNKTLVQTLRDVLKAAQTVEDEGTINLVDERISIHEKAAWMLDSSLEDA